MNMIITNKYLLKISLGTILVLIVFSFAIYVLLAYFPYTGNWKKFGAADQSIFTDGYYTVTTKYPPNWSVSMNEPGIMSRNELFTFSTGSSSTAAYIESFQVRLDSDVCEYYSQYEDVECSTTQEGMDKVVTAHYFDAVERKYVLEIGHYFPSRTIRYLAKADSKEQLSLLERVGSYFKLTISSDFDTAYTLATDGVESNSNYQNKNIFAGDVRNPVDISYDVWNQVQIPEYGIHYAIPEGYYLSTGPLNRVIRNGKTLFTVTVINSYLLGGITEEPLVSWEEFLKKQPPETLLNGDNGLSWDEYHHIKDTFSPNDEVNGISSYQEIGYGKIYLEPGDGENAYYYRTHLFIQNGLNYVRITFPIDITNSNLQNSSSEEILALLNSKTLPGSIQQQKDIFDVILRRFTVDNKFSN